MLGLGAESKSFMPHMGFDWGYSGLFYPKRPPPAAGFEPKDEKFYGLLKEFYQKTLVC